ncbi:Eukaryotic translation initiation factor 3 subunit K, partial [Tetrabaena socialis]
ADETIYKTGLGAGPALMAPGFRVTPVRLRQVVQLANALETSRFADFWTAANTCRDLLATIPGFYESVRGYIAHTLVHTYGRITKRTLADCLKLEGATLEQYLSDKCRTSGWSIVSTPSGEVVGMPKNECNSQSVVKRTQELIRFDQVAPMLKAVTVGF